MFKLSLVTFLSFVLFQLTQAVSVTITSPKPNDVLKAGETVEIKWFVLKCIIIVVAASFFFNYSVTCAGQLQITLNSIMFRLLWLRALLKHLSLIKSLPPVQMPKRDLTSGLFLNLSNPRPNSMLLHLTPSFNSISLMHGIVSLRLVPTLRILPLLVCCII